MIAFLALMSAVLGGGADFLGGRVSRSLPATVVVLASEGVALVVSTLVALTLVSGGVTGPGILWASLAGVFAGSGLVAFYTAMASGKVSTVAPLAAMSVCVPVAYGLAVRGESPSIGPMIGAAAAIIGIVLVSGPELQGAGGVRPLQLAAVAAVCFGLVSVFLAKTSSQNAAASSAIMRVSEMLCLAIVIAAMGVRTTVKELREQAGWLAGIGVLSTGALTLLSYTLTNGLVSVVSVLAGLYPVVPVLLARWLYRETIRRIQAVGILSALVGVVLLSMPS